MRIQCAHGANIEHTHDAAVPREAQRNQSRPMDTRYGCMPHMKEMAHLELEGHHPLSGLERCGTCIMNTCTRKYPRAAALEPGHLMYSARVRPLSWREEACGLVHGQVGVEVERGDAGERFAHVLDLCIECP